MGRGIAEGDLIHTKAADGAFDFTKVYVVVEAFCSAEDFNMYVSAYLHGKPPKADRVFGFTEIQKIGPLHALALCAPNDDEDIG